MAAVDIELLGDEMDVIARGLVDRAALVAGVVQNGGRKPDAGPSTSRVTRAIADAHDAIAAFTRAVSTTGDRMVESVRLYEAADSATAAELSRIRS